MAVIPKRTEDLVDQRPSRVDRVTSGVFVEPVVPKPHRGWHPVAKRVWDSFEGSGQVHFWQSSDWAVAYSVVDDLSRYKRAEDRVEKALKDAERWRVEVSHLSPDERVEAGYSRQAPVVPRAASPQKLETIYRVLGTLLVTETDRRRARIELESSVEEVEDPILRIVQGYGEGLSG